MSCKCLIKVTFTNLNGNSILIHSDLCISHEQKCYHPKAKGNGFEFGLTLKIITIKVNESIWNKCENNYIFCCSCACKMPLFVMYASK